MLILAHEQGLPPPALDPVRPASGAPETRDLPVLVLGAGIAGLGAARHLAAQGLPVTVVDAAPEIGGAHRSSQIGPYVFDHGSIFYEDRAALFAAFPEIAGLCPPIHRIQRRIAPDGRLQHYPLDPREVLHWPKARLAAATADLLASRLLCRRDGTVEAICRQRLGRSIYQTTGLAAYIRRFHHVAPAELDEEFFFRRMAPLERQSRALALAKALLRSLAGRPPGQGKAPPLRLRPEAGFSALFTPIQRALSASGVRFVLDATVQRISRAGAANHSQVFTVTTSKGILQGRAVLGALPLDSLHRAVFDRPSGLEALDLMTLFVSAATAPQGFGHVLYNFHTQGRWKRATFYARLYPGHPTGREFLSVEVTLPPGAAPDPEAAFADFAAHQRALRLDLPDLRLEGHALTPQAYPLYRRTPATSAAQVIAALTEFGILPIGRQGRFEYLPTSSGVLHRVAQEITLHPALAGIAAEAP